MIKAICRPDGPPTFEASVNGIAIYLDNFAIKSLAKGDASLRQRFVATLRNGADLLFSVTNSIELCGPQGTSSVKIKAFLNQCGAHWYPVELNSLEVLRREAAGLHPGRCCLAEGLLEAFFSNRTHEHAPGSGRVIDLSEAFFQLGTFIDWLAPEREWFIKKSAEFDAELMSSIAKLRNKQKKNPGWLNRTLPTPPFASSKAAGFAYVHLMRELISDSGYQVKKGDGMDFCHAVMASAFANFATLDKQWKRRVENLPKPNGVARIYYLPELSAMVADVESALSQLKQTRNERSGVLSL